MTLNEALDVIRFRYDRPSAHTRYPKVIVLDNEYPGQEGQKDYGKTLDVLGVKLNGLNNRDRKELQKKIEDIYSQDIDKLDKYLRLSAEVKECLPRIRRYKKRHMKHIMKKEKWFYKPMKEV